jgi:hypothetical protein
VSGDRDKSGNTAATATHYYFHLMLWNNTEKQLGVVFIIISDLYCNNIVIQSNNFICMLAPVTCYKFLAVVGVVADWFGCSKT